MNSEHNAFAQSSSPITVGSYGYLIDLGPNLTRPTSINENTEVVGGVYRYSPSIGTTQLLPLNSGSQTGALLTRLSSSGTLFGYTYEAVRMSGSFCSTHLFPIPNHLPLSLIEDATESGSVAGACGEVCYVPGYSYFNGTACAVINGTKKIYRFESVNSPRDSARAINSKGEVAGIASRNSGGVVYQRAFLASSSAEMTDLGTLGGLSSSAWGINESGIVVGRADIDNNAFPTFHAFIYSRTIGMRDIGTLGGRSSATAINDSNIVVGYSEISGPTSSNAFIYDPSSGITNLNSLLPKGTGWTLGTASDINNNGEIIGAGLLNGTPRGYLITKRSDAVNWDASPIATKIAPSALSAKLRIVGKCAKTVARRKPVKKNHSCSFQIRTTNSTGSAGDVAFSLERSTSRKGPWRRVYSGHTDAMGRKTRKVRLKKGGYFRVTSIQGNSVFLFPQSSILRVRVK